MCHALGIIYISHLYLNHSDFDFLLLESFQAFHDLLSSPVPEIKQRATLIITLYFSSDKLFHFAEDKNLFDELCDILRSYISKPKENSECLNAIAKAFNKILKSKTEQNTINKIFWAIQSYTLRSLLCIWLMQ